MRLWVTPVPRHVRFHDLRHTTATLLLKGGVPLATVQRILRHTDPRLTSEIYGHLDVEDMRTGIEHLQFVGLPQMEKSAAKAPKTSSHGAPVVRTQRVTKNKAPGPVDFSSKSEGFK